jgi:diguanylate cyclase (GGDEF)-like protein/PAS domain S-box-containing protein
MLSGLCFSWVLIFINFDFDSLIITIPIFIFAGVTNILVGFLFIKQFQKLCCAKGVGYVFIIWGLHKLDYPLLHSVSWFAPYGYVFGSLLAIILAIGLLIVYFNHIKLNLVNSEKKFKALFNNSSDFISIIDKKGEVLDVNLSMLRYTKFTIYDFIGKKLWDTKLWSDDNNLLKERFITAQSYEVVKFQTTHNINSKKIYVDIMIKAVKKDDEIDFFIVEEHDITDIIISQEKMKSLYYIDSLTSLPNRFSLIEDLKKFKNPSLGIFNIDAFKEINDFYGYKVGDIIIKEFGNILLKFLGEEKLYRIYADEFAILSQDEESLKEKVSKVLAYIQKYKIYVQTNDITISATVGVATSNENIIIKADMALKRAKEKKRDFLIYTDMTDMAKEYENNLFWINKIQNAIAEDRIVPFYQAIMDNRTKEIKKYESLVRMIDIDGKIISPFFFLEISKKAKLYPKITKIVIEKSFKEFSKRLGISFSINLTIDDILNDDIKEFIIDKLDEYKVSDRLIIELVETEGIMNYDDVMEFINYVKKRGVKIAIDDFGTGYSNFEYLIKLNADFIKIDGSMIKNIDTNKSSLAVVEVIVNFAKKNDFKTIAEFVSSKELLDIVNYLGIDYTQGYYIAEPKEKI